MVHLIDKDKLVERIEKRREEHFNSAGSPSSEYCYEDDEILRIIDTLKVKEVDLKKEIQDHIKECLDAKFPTTDIELIKKDVAYTARKFFALGLKAKQG